MNFFLINEIKESNRIKGLSLMQKKRIRSYSFFIVKNEKKKPYIQ